jgi:hypothetical protein
MMRESLNFKDHTDENKAYLATQRFENKLSKKLGIGTIWMSCVEQWTKLWMFTSIDFERKINAAVPNGY